MTPPDHPGEPGRSGPPSWTPPPGYPRPAGAEPDPGAGQPAEPAEPAGPDGEPEPAGHGEPGPPRGRRVAVVATGVVGALLVLVAAIALPRALGREPDRAQVAETGTRTGTRIAGLEVFGDMSTEHTREDVDYPQSPPVGGPHDPVWLACGAYDQPVRSENAVHDLEHGSVWISYDPDLDADDVAALETRLPDNGIMAPYPGLDHAFVMTVWGRQLALDDVEDPRLVQFLEQFGGGEAALEPFVGCQGGTTDPDGREVVGA